MTSPAGSENDSLIDLQGKLTKHFSLEELRTLSFELGVDHDELGGEGRSARARELVTYMDRRGRLPVLIDAAQRERPDVDWSGAPKLSEPRAVDDSKNRPQHEVAQTMDEVGGRVIGALLEQDIDANVSISQDIGTVGSKGSVTGLHFGKSSGADKQASSGDHSEDDEAKP